MATKTLLEIKRKKILKSKQSKLVEKKWATYRDTGASKNTRMIKIQIGGTTYYCSRSKY